MKFTRKKRLEELEDKMHDYVVGTLPRIEVEPKQGLFNKMCFFNAVDYSERHEQDIKVAEVIIVEEGFTYLHYINVDEAGVYLETSLGFRATYIDYYLVRIIPSEDYHRIHKLFDNAQRAYADKFLNWYDRYVLKINDLL